MPKTKIIASIGPASASEKVLLRMIREGVDLVRINYAHAVDEERENLIKLIKSVEESYGIVLPIIGDLQGPTIRTGNHKTFSVKKGEEIKIVCSSETSEPKTIPIPNTKVYSIIDEEDLVVIGAGALRLRVTKIENDFIKCMALNDAVIEPRRTLILPYKELPLPVITDKDLKDIEFSINKVDFLALSFVRNKDDVKTLKDILHDKGGEYIGVIAKIETRKAIENIDQILDEADAILVARGDLGMYFSLEEIPRLQEYLVRKARMKSKPVIVATQLLESMINSPYPTRSEVVDIMVAVQQGVDALLLAGETAIGKYPVEAVKWLKRIISEAEKVLPNIRGEESIREDIYTKFAKGVVLLADSLNAKILLYTKKGNTARRISRFRPRASVYAITNDIKVMRKLKLLWGVTPYLSSTSDISSSLRELTEILKNEGELSYGDIIVSTGGMREGATDLIRVHVYE